VFEQPGLSSVGSTQLEQLVLTHTGLPIAFYAWHWMERSVYVFILQDILLTKVSDTLMKEAADISETYVCICQTACCHNPEGTNLE